MDNFDLRKFLAEGKLYEAEDKDLQKLGEEMEKQLKALGLDTKVFGGEDAVPNNAKAQIEKNPKLAALAYFKGPGLGGKTQETLEVNVHKDHLEGLKKIASSLGIESRDIVNMMGGSNILRIKLGRDISESLNEAMFDVATTEKIAQHIADEFTAEDSNDLDLKYVVSPGVEAGHFDLDVEAGPNTPGDDWKDENGFGIENYLGQYAGGSFLIKDGVVINAAMRSAPVANVTPEGEVEMISAEESRAAIGMEEDVDMAAVQSDENEAEDQVDEAKEETKSNKMKKSELKEMIKAAFLNEKETFDQAFDRIDKEKEVYQGSDKDDIKETLSDTAFDMMQDVVDALGAEKAIEELVRAMSDDDALSYLEYIIRVNDINSDKEVDDIPGFEGTKDALNKLGLEEAEEDEEVEVDADVDVDVDAEADAEEGGEEVDVEASEEEEIDVKEKAKVDPNVKAVQDALTIAQTAAAELGDDKLTDQIGNTITFFTRAHVASVDKEAMAEDLNVNEVSFPMWTKINK